jgi:hypothetical protein
MMLQAVYKVVKRVHEARAEPGLNLLIFASVCRCRDYDTIWPRSEGSSQISGSDGFF